MIHALVVDAKLDNSRTFRVECPGVTDDCRMWIECGPDDGCDPAKLDLLAEDGDDEPELHGKRHRNMGGWMAATERCFLAGHRDLADAADDLWDVRGPAPLGRFPVEIDHDPYDDPSDLRLRLVDQPDGIPGDEPGLPDPAKAAERVRVYIEAAGDGVYDMAGCAPLYGRDLEALSRAVLARTQEVDRLTRRLANEEKASVDTIRDRDRAESLADQLAAVIERITGVEVGEHSNMNDPWENALQAATEYADSAARARQA